MITNDIVRIVSLGAAGITLPVGYVAVCLWLFRRKTWWFTYISYFVLFGTAGGWAFAIAMSPSGLTASSLIFLFTAALAACLVSSFVLTFRSEKSREDWIALIGGYSYPILLGTFFVVAMLSSQSTR